MRNLLLGILSQRADWVIQITGRTGVTSTAGTMVFSATEVLAVEATGDVSISLATSDDNVYKLHTVTINCTNDGIGTVVVKSPDKIVSLGNHRGGNSTPNIDYYTGTDATAPILSWNLGKGLENLEKIRQALGYDYILQTNSMQALPVNLTFLLLNGNNITWTYTGALPVNLTYIYLYGNNITWTYAGALPVNLGYLYLSGNNINWTGLDLGGLPPISITRLLLNNYVITPLTIAQLLILLQNIDAKTANLPITATVRDYDNNPATTDIAAAIPSIDGTEAQQARYWINQILGHGGITTFQLNTTDIIL